MNAAEISADAVLEFWFGNSVHDPQAAAKRQKRWFGTDAGFDADVRRVFAGALERAAAGELRRWALQPEGVLALIIMFDQFPRNIFRGLPDAFAYDVRAQALCRDGVIKGTDTELGVVHRLFFYMPLEHAEDRDAQAMSVECFEALHAGAPVDYAALTQNALSHAREHRALIERFGRFPHRNLALNRESTADETAWLVENAGRYGQGG